jgi:hypothetical protein
MDETWLITKSAGADTYTVIAVPTDTGMTYAQAMGEVECINAALEKTDHLLQMASAYMVGAIELQELELTAQKHLDDIRQRKARILTIRDRFDAQVDAIRSGKEGEL